MSGNTPQSTAVPPRRSRVAATVSALTLALTVAAPGAAVAAERYRVAPGDTLAEIATEFGYTGKNDWRRLYDANPEIDHPDLILPGQKLTIPGKREKLKRRKLPAQQAVEVPAPRRDAAAVSRGGDTTAAAPSAPGGGVWTALAQCESGGNWSTNTGNGYYGGLQFSLASWRAVGGTGYPHEASPATQIAMGQRLQASQGWSAWPGCAAELGLG